MATMPTGQAVAIATEHVSKFRFAPPAGDMYIAVHAGAFKSPANIHTQVVIVLPSGPIWLGALGEDLLVPVSGPARTDARQAVARTLLTGQRLWEFVLPGPLLKYGVPEPFSTVYGGDRPWLVVGETPAGLLIACPLNKPSNPKWYAPRVPTKYLMFAGSRDSQVELAHAWTIPPSAPEIGRLAAGGTQDIEAAINKFYV